MKTIGLRAAAGIGLTALLLACGQKGPLVLPDAQHTHKKLGMPKPATPSPSPAPAPSGNDGPGTSTSVATPPK
jgi:predicted small lipoprotein YifL